MPAALAIGITYDLFWHLNPKKLEPFLDAHNLKRQEESEKMWIMGQYIMSALDATVCNAMPFMKRSQKGKYLKEPIRVTPLTEEEQQEKEERELQKFIAFSGVLEIQNNGIGGK